MLRQLFMKKAIDAKRGALIISNSLGLNRTQQKAHLHIDVRKDILDSENNSVMSIVTGHNDREKNEKMPDYEKRSECDLLSDLSQD